jgi:hypothetical protein
MKEAHIERTKATTMVTFFGWGPHIALGVHPPPPPSGPRFGLETVSLTVATWMDKESSSWLPGWCSLDIFITDDLNGKSPPPEVVVSVVAVVLWWAGDVLTDTVLPRIEKSLLMSYIYIYILYVPLIMQQLAAWAGVGLVNWDLDLLQYQRDI